MNDNKSVNIEELEDRLIVRTRKSALTHVDLTLPSAVILKFGNALEIGISGSWKVTSSPGAKQDDGGIPIETLIGVEALSLVLFATGSMRLVLTGGLTLSTDAAVGAEVWVRQDGVFAWHAVDGAVKEIKVIGQ